MSSFIAGLLIGSTMSGGSDRYSKSDEVTEMDKKVCQSFVDTAVEDKECPEYLKNI